MSLFLQQRIDRLRVGAAELALWRVIDQRPIEGWIFDGVPIARWAPWLTIEGARLHQAFRKASFNRSNI